MLHASSVLLLAIASVQAPDPFNFSPPFGSPSGGTAITITANLPSIDFTAAPPSVRFGTAVSPQVTVVSAHTLIATTPGHPEGVVKIDIGIGGVDYESPRYFGFVRQREALLLPVAIETPGWLGTVWTTDISVFNDSDEPVNLNSEVCFFIGAAFPCGDPLVVEPHRSLRVPPRVATRDDSYSQRYLYPPSDAVERLHFSVRVRDRANATDLGTEIPVIPRSRFRHGRVVLTNVPVSDSHRALLRIYDAESVGGNSIGVRVYDEATGTLLSRRETGLRPVPTDNPLMFQFAYSDLLRDPAVRGHATNVRIEVEESGADLWALLTLTNNETQRITVITSQ